MTNDNAYFKTFEKHQSTNKTNKNENKTKLFPQEYKKHTFI